LALVINSSDEEEKIPNPSFCLSDLGCLIFLIFTFSPNFFLKKELSEEIPSIRPSDLASSDNQKVPEKICLKSFSLIFLPRRELTQLIKF